MSEERWSRYPCRWKCGDEVLAPQATRGAPPLIAFLIRRWKTSMIKMNGSGKSGYVSLSCNRSPKANYFCNHEWHHRLRLNPCVATRGRLVPATLRYVSMSTAAGSMVHIYRYNANRDIVAAKEKRSCGGCTYTSIYLIMYSMPRIYL
jgi:hypothetical protein